MVFTVSFRALFPCDDSMVCIIDDREDIWDCAPNLVTVKPYRFFEGTGDINAPPGSDQAFTHASAIPLHENATDVEVKNTTVTDGKGEDVDDDGEGKKDIEAPSVKNSTDIYEKSGNNESLGKEKEVHEINHNEKLTTSEEICEGKESTDGDTVPEKEETVKSDKNETQENDVQSDHSEQESEEANSQVSEKPNGEDVVDGNHIEDHDDYLLYLEEILRRIHSSFYEVVSWNRQAQENGNDSVAAHVAPDLRYIVPELRRNVLKGANIVFTGVIPRNCRHEDSQAWKIGKQFGASISKDLLTQKNTAERNARTTHVIAARPGTEKSCQASRLPNVQLVNPNWLWTCAERWDWVDERLFPMEDYHEYKARKNDTPTSSIRGTPKRQPENEVNPKNNKVALSDGDDLEHITDNNLRIVLNPFLNFSSGEMEAMDKEVEDLMKSSDEEDDDDKDEKILGSVSSSSNSTENGDSFTKVHQSVGQDSPDGGDASKGQTINFSTIKQNRSHDDGSPSKRRKLDFFVEDKSGVDVKEGADDDGSQEEFSSDAGGSSGSNSGDDDGNDMAAMLEEALYRS